MAKVMEELHEFEEALASGNQEHTEAELGDLLFAIANLGRFLALDTEEALRKTINRFQKRFSHVEEQIHQRGLSLHDATLEEMDLLWNEAKRKERDI